MNPKSEYDVIIIGGGPSGSTTAKYAALSGAKVLVVDKHAEIGSPKRCGEGLGIRVFNEFKIPIDERFINRPIYGIAAYAPNGNVVKIRYDKISGYIIERKIFDKYLATEAVRSGVDVFSNTKAELLKDGGSGIIGIKAKRFGEITKIKGKIIVAADGVDSIIARDAGIKSTLNPLHMDSCIEYEMAGIEFDESDLLHLYLGTDVAPRGYIWIFPKDDDRANVGIGILGTEKKTAKYYLDKFINKKEGLKKGSILEVNVGAVPVGGFLEEMVKDNVIVVGDAARQVNPIHGGGMKEVMLAARIAGEKIGKAIKEDNLDILMEYEEDWWNTHGEALKKVLKVRKLSEKLTDEDMNYLSGVWTGDDLVELSRGNYRDVFKKALKNPKLLSILKNFI